jgi:hypothetical protein
MEWRSEQAKLIQSGKYSPHTLNTDLGVLKVILKHAKIELGLLSIPLRTSRASTRLSIGRTRGSNRTLSRRPSRTFSRPCASSFRSTSR